MDHLVPFLLAHWTLSLAFIVLLVLIFIVEQLCVRKNTMMIGPQEVIGLINHENAVVVDIRKKDVFVRGHIVNAVHLPFAELKNDIKKIAEHREKPIVVVCAQGVQAVKAAEMIQSYEFNQVKVLKGGMQAWKEAQLPVEKK